jgi:acyl transferase domain-containing protein
MSTAAAAIIGVSFELPLCSEWEQAIAIFRNGRDCVRAMPRHRATSTGVEPGPHDREVGWVDEIAAFDRRYFGLSRAEAELIDPRQRRLLQLAVTTIGNAG